MRQRTRADIQQDLISRRNQIQALQDEIREYIIEDLLLCDHKQWFSEREEEVVISRRPKKTENRLIGRIHWKEFFKDESYPDDPAAGVWVTISQIVRINGEWTW